MKKSVFLTLLFMAVAFMASAQAKKVAVMETKANEGVSSFQCNMVRGSMETAVASAPGYEGYDRASFDAILKEQNFQRSGAVDETQIKALGQMAGVQYVLVSEASTEDGYFYIQAKLLDVETGRFLNSAGQLCESTPLDIKEACAELGATLFGLNANATPDGKRPGYSTTDPKDNGKVDKNALLDRVNKALAAGNAVGAIGDLKELLRIEPNAKEVAFTLGTIYGDNNNSVYNPTTAISYYEQAINIAPDYYDANYNLGALYVALSNELAMQANNCLSDANKYDGLVAQSKQKLRKGLPYLEKAYELRRDADVLTVLKAVYKRLGVSGKY